MVVVMPDKLGARVLDAFILAAPPIPLILILPIPIMLPLILCLPWPPSSEMPMPMPISPAFGSRMLYCAIVLIFLVTHPAKILPRCFSPSLDLWKSPFCTKETMSMTSWCSLRMALTMTGTMLARKLRRKISTTMTTRPPAWKTALQFVSCCRIRIQEEQIRTSPQERCSGGSAPQTAQCPLRSGLGR